MSAAIFISGVLITSAAGWRLANGIHSPQATAKLSVIAIAGYLVMLVAFIFVRN